MTDTTHSARAFREQALSAVVHRACSACNAPGVYSDLDWVYASFPGCWVDPADERVGQPVGDSCPNCGGRRSQTLTQKLGEIWRRRYF